MYVKARAIEMPENVVLNAKVIDHGDVGMAEPRGDEELVLEVGQVLDSPSRGRGQSGRP